MAVAERQVHLPELEGLSACLQHVEDERDIRCRHLSRKSDSRQCDRSLKKPLHLISGEATFGVFQLQGKIDFKELRSQPLVRDRHIEATKLSRGQERKELKHQHASGEVKKALHVLVCEQKWERLKGDGL